MRLLVILILFITSCSTAKRIHLPEPAKPESGIELIKKAFAFNWKQRDSLVIKEFLQGNVPSFLTKFVAIEVKLKSEEGREIKAVYYVSPDYLSIGKTDWVRMPVTPMAAQLIADSIDCFLPTRKMVNDIYQASNVKLEPVPMYAFRDSTPTMYHHHLIIEGQRNGRKGLISGIKKDVTISEKVSRDAKPNRVAIYGWHKLDGKPIQPLYSGHVNWYVDYSHGIRLVYRKIKVNNKWMDYEDVLKDKQLRNLLCDEEYCDFYKYSY